MKLLRFLENSGILAMLGMALLIAIGFGLTIVYNKAGLQPCVAAALGFGTIIMGGGLISLIYIIVEDAITFIKHRGES